ncbi:hypothetical protein DF119_22425, partial [Burkholderia stagnalis]
MPVKSSNVDAWLAPDPSRRTELREIHPRLCRGFTRASPACQDNTISPHALPRHPLDFDAVYRCEPPRILWRLQLLREWSHEQEGNQVF